MDISDIITSNWNELITRTDGPLHFRLILQPIMASFFAVRDGLRDAREGQMPYFWTVSTDKAHRRERLKSGWHSVGKIFILAVVLDVINSILVFRRIFPIQTLLVATVLALIPYLAIRGPVNRIARRRNSQDRRTDRAA